MLRFENINFWLTLDDDVIKVRNLSNNSRNIDFKSMVFLVNINLHKISGLLIFNKLGFNNVVFNWARRMTPSKSEICPIIQKI